MNLFAGSLLILLALVHLVFAGQKLQRIDLTPGLAREGSWLFSQLFSDPAVHWLAIVSLVISVSIFLAAGPGHFPGAGWWHNATLSAGGISAVIHLLTWDGKVHRLPGQGGAGNNLIKRSFQ